jgi:hypothetical protein
MWSNQFINKNEKVKSNWILNPNMQGVYYYKLRHLLFKNLGGNVMCKSKVLFKAIVVIVFCLNFTACKSSVGTCIEGNCTNGRGTLVLPNGDKYVGEFKDSVANGQGTITWQNGGRYMGEFKDGVANGQGTLTYPDGIKYVGEIKDNKANGKGTLTYCDSAKYVGEFKGNKFNGQGTLTYTDGRIKRGVWKDNKIEKLVE